MKRFYCYCTSDIDDDNDCEYFDSDNDFCIKYNKKIKGEFEDLDNIFYYYKLKECEF